MENILYYNSQEKIDFEYKCCKEIYLFKLLDESYMVMEVKSYHTCWGRSTPDVWYDTFESESLARDYIKRKESEWGEL